MHIKWIYERKSLSGINFATEAAFRGENIGFKSLPRAKIFGRKKLWQMWNTENRSVFSCLNFHLSHFAFWGEDHFPCSNCTRAETPKSAANMSLEALNWSLIRDTLSVIKYFLSAHGFSQNILGLIIGLEKRPRTAKKGENHKHICLPQMLYRWGVKIYFP